MKLIPQAIFTIVFISLFATPLFATEDTSVSDLVGTTNTTTGTTQENTASTDNPLSVNVPTLTDNPSTIITFINPSPDNAGIQLEIDSKGFADITSPYTFSALSIGRHTLEFKYQDENKATQLYDTSIIIIPRAPILNTPVIDQEAVTISGTGLANSEIIVLLSSGTTVLNETAVIDGDGKWTISFSQADLTKDVYSLNAYTRRYGYASNLSETTKFTLDDQSIAKNLATTFDINNITLESVESWIISNKNYMITAFAGLALGVLIGILGVSKNKQNHEKKIEKKVAEKFTKVESKGKEITLREKLMMKESEIKAEKPSTDKKEEKKEEEAVINKIDFLKDFKNFDPDNSKGEEYKPSVEVSLTSKK